MDEEFEIREGSFNEIKKTIIIKSLIIGILASGAGLAIGFFNTNHNPDNVNTFPFVIPIVIGAIGFGLYRGIKQSKKLFENYKLIINETVIIREQYNTPTISIPVNEIKTIVKSNKGVLTIVGNSKTDVIGVPSQINNFIKIEEILSQIKPITISNKKIVVEKYKWLFIFSPIALMVCVYLSKNKVIIGLTGTALILLLSYCFYLIRLNKNIDKKTKSRMWWLIVVLFSIIGTMYFKMSGKI